LHGTGEGDGIRDVLLAHKPHQPEGGDGADQHLFTDLVLPVMHSLAVMAVAGAGQRQPDDEIRQINRGAHVSSRSNRAALLSCSLDTAKGPSIRGRPFAEGCAAEPAGVALSPCSTRVRNNAGVAPVSWTGR